MSLHRGYEFALHRMFARCQAVDEAACNREMRATVQNRFAPRRKQ